MKKVLVNSIPQIVTYPDHTHMLSVMSSHENYYDWLYSNNIQLFTDDDDNNLWLAFFPIEKELRKFCPLIISQTIERKLVKKLVSDVIQFFIECIDEDYFLHFCANSYFIRAYENMFNKVYRFHEIFIFGYDTEKSQFYVADFFNNKYEHRVISFDEIREAYNSVETYSSEEKHDNIKYTIFCIDSLNGVELLKCNDAGQYLFDLNNVVDYLSDYLHSSNSADRYRAFKNPQVINKGNNLVFGIKIYQRLIFHIESLNNHQNSDANVRSFHILYEHKKCMYQRMKHLASIKINIDIQFFINQCQKVMDLALLLRNMLMKYNISGNKELLLRAVDIVIKIRDDEETVLNKLHNELSILLKRGLLIRIK